MNKHLSLWSSVLVWLVLAATARADFAARHWEFRKPIRGGGTAGWVLLELDREVLRHARDDLADLRVLEEGGAEAPYGIIASRDDASAVEQAAKLFNVSFLPGQSTTFLLDLGQNGLLHNRIVLRTSSENFRRMVEVESSTDQNSWRYLTRAGQIYDYTVRNDIKPVKAQDTRVDYPENALRYLRVTILDRGEPPLVINGASVWRQAQPFLPETPLTPAFTTSRNATERTTQIVADRGSRGIPTRRAVINVENPSFSRLVEVSASDDAERWEHLSSGYIFRIATEKFRGEHLSLSHPETQKRYLKLTIHDRDDAPLGIRSIETPAVPRAIALRLEPTKSHWLYYGNPKARRPEYDVERLLAYEDTARMALATLGSEERNEAFVPTLPPLTERSRYLLPLMLGAIVALLTLLLIRLFRRTTEKH